MQVVREISAVLLRQSASPQVRALRRPVATRPKWCPCDWCDVRGTPTCGTGRVAAPPHLVPARHTTRAVAPTLRPEVCAQTRVVVRREPIPAQEDAGG
ncbi:hypothetical protein GCM10027517_29050 [Phycicoccus ginsengisoli]